MYRRAFVAGVVLRLVPPFASLLPRHTFLPRIFSLPRCIFFPLVKYSQGPACRLFSVSGLEEREELALRIRIRIPVTLLHVRVHCLIMPPTCISLSSHFLLVL